MDLQKFVQVQYTDGCNTLDFSTCQAVKDIMSMVMKGLQLSSTAMLSQNNIFNMSNECFNGSNFQNSRQ